MDGVEPIERERPTLLLAFLACAAIVLLVIVRASPGLADDSVAAALLAGTGGVLCALWPSLDYRLVNRPMAPLIAFIGCDGSGKSTLTEDIERSLAASLPVRTCYLGLGSGTLGARIRTWPLIGAAIERRLAQKAAQSRTKGQRIPGVATAAVIYVFSLLRLRRFKRMLRLRAKGYVVLTDRYPQNEIAGFYDGPGLSAARAESWAVGILVQQERRIYAWMSAFRPDAVVRLNVEASTALRRKPDHRADLIVRKVAITPALRFAGARIVDLDAEQPYAAVRTLAAGIVRDAIETSVSRRGGKASSSKRGLRTDIGHG